MTLTERQQLILDYIRRHIREQGMPPTRTEIARFMGFRSANGAEGHLRALERKGVISLRANASRGIVLTLEAPAEDDGLPLVGKVAAGVPILAQEHIESRYRVDPALFRPRADYLLRVQGQSMRNAGILDGDLLAVHRQPSADNGAIVVARLEDEVTVKRLRRSGDQVWLLPENPDFQPILVDLGTQPLVIEGIGVGVLRSAGPL